MEIAINIDNLEHANHFLRALWAEFRKSFGNYKWQQSLKKDGENRRIYFGYISLPNYVDDYGTMQVSISYVKRGSIKSIYFYFLFPPSGSLPDGNSELALNLRRAVNSALEKVNNLTSYILQVSVQSVYGAISYYTGNSFSLVPTSARDFMLALKVEGYDEIDADYQFDRKVNYIKDFLSVETNSLFESASVACVMLAEENPEFFLTKNNIKNEFFMENQDWIDGSPRKDEYIILSKEGKELIDFITANNPQKPLLTFLRACNHFHGARGYEINAGRYYDREVAYVLYMSALEVASLVDEDEAPKSCSQCGQKIYSISQRVKALVEKYISLDKQLASHIGKIIKDIYSKRSKYLHNGQDKSFKSYLSSGGFQPQLDPDNPTGCETNFTMNNTGIMLN
jgi:hypothetical protein